MLLVQSNAVDPDIFVDVGMTSENVKHKVEIGDPVTLVRTVGAVVLGMMALVQADAAPLEVMARLGAVTPRLRALVAAEICRKRVPMLVAAANPAGIDGQAPIASRSCLSSSSASAGGDA